MKVFLILSVFFTVLMHSFINAEQDSFNIARELCVAALVKPSRENCDAAYLFGKRVLNSMSKEDKNIKWFKGLLCTSCFNCSNENLKELVGVANDVIEFNFHEIDNAEIHIIHAYFVKLHNSIYNFNVNEANAYMKIVCHLVRNYKESHFNDAEVSGRMQNMISITREMLSIITE